MLVLASYKRQRGGALARDFELTSKVLDDAARNDKLEVLRQLFQVRGNSAAIDALSGVAFQFVNAYNSDLQDPFDVLHASVNVVAYEHLRQVHEAQPSLFETIRQTLTNDCDIFVGYIAAEIAVRGSDANPSSTEALERAIDDMKALMVAIGRRERSLKDEQTKQDFARLRKELLKYRAIAPPPPLVAECADEWAFWRRLSEADGSYAGRSAIIAEQFEAAYANVLSTGTDIDLSTFFANRGLQLGAQIGHGGFGIVYRAKHELLSDRAIKIFQPRFFEKSSTALLRFTREASLLERVAHPRIVRFFDAGVAPTGTPFIITAFVRGKCVDDVLRERGALPLEEAVALMRQVLDGLRAAHNEGIAHRDIKPSNVMWHKGVATILDLGSAGFIDNFVTTRLTQTAQGTPGYLAPEQIDDPQTVDLRSDFFAAGQMFHQLITGKLVQPGNLGHYLTGVTGGAAIHSFLTRAMAPLAQRFHDVASMDNALTALLPAKESAAIVERGDENVNPSSYLVEEADIRSTLGLNRRWSVTPGWTQWAHAQLTAPSDRLGLTVRLVRLVAVWLDSRGAGWIDEGDVLSMTSVVFGLTENIATEHLTTKIQVTLKEAVRNGWLREEEHDTWHPGMPSGTGMRTGYLLTPLGKKAIADAGYNPPAPDDVPF